MPDSHRYTEAALAHRLLNDLTAIRCAAEILRDVPELGHTDRKRFATVVLDGERRLEALMPHVIPTNPLP